MGIIVISIEEQVQTSILSQTTKIVIITKVCDDDNDDDDDDDGKENDRVGTKDGEIKLFRKGEQGYAFNWSVGNDGDYQL